MQPGRYLQGNSTYPDTADYESLLASLGLLGADRRHINSLAASKLYSPREPRLIRCAAQR